jgi:hypothetical protein
MFRLPEYIITKPIEEIVSVLLFLTTAERTASATKFRKRTRVKSNYA